MIIWLASYPRSGNTLLRIILNAAFDRRSHSKHEDARDIAADARTADAVGHAPLGASWAEAYPRMRDSAEPFFVKTHDRPDDAGKAIYVVRDGRAASVSYQHYINDFAAGTGSVPVSMADVVLGFTPFGSWGSHLDEWDPARRPDTLLLRYEDVVADPGRAIRQVAKFAGIEPVRTWENNFEELHRINPKFFRAGPAAHSEAELSPADAELFWAHHADWMAALGYEVRGAARESARALRARLADHGRDLANLASARERMEGQLREAWVRTARGEAELDAARTEAARLQAEVTRWQGETARLQAQLAAAQQAAGRIEAQESALASVLEEIGKLSGRLTAGRRHLDDVASRGRDLEQRYRQARVGYGAAMKRLTTAEAHLESVARSRACRALWALNVMKRPEWANRDAAAEGNEQLHIPPPLSSGDRVTGPATSLAQVWDDLSREVAAVRAAGAAVAGPTTPIDEPESEMDQALRHLVKKGFRPRVVLDVGSAKGYWSERTAYYHFKDAEYFMIDPLPSSEQHLKELSERSERFKYILTAVGSQPGELVMNLTEDCDGSSLLEFPNAKPERQRVVPVETLDRLLSDGRVKSPDLVKVDVQGFEMEVLRGATEILRLAEVFIIEVNLFEFMPKAPLAHEVVGFMAQQGFRLYDFAGFLRRPFENDLGQMDLVFVANRSPLVASNKWA